MKHPDNGTEMNHGRRRRYIKMLEQMQAVYERSPKAVALRAEVRQTRERERLENNERIKACAA